MDKTKVAVAVSEAIDVTPVHIVKHNKARVTVARPMDASEQEAFALGETLALHIVDGEMHLEDALRACKTAVRRAALREGFASQWAAVRGVALAAGTRKFDRMVEEMAGVANRKAKSKAKRKAGGGRKAKTGARQVNATDKAPQWNAAALAFIAKRMRTVDADSDHSDDLAAIAAILHGEAPGSKRKASKRK